MADLDLLATSELCILHPNAEGFETWRRKLDFRLKSNSICGRPRGIPAERLDAGDETGLRPASEKSIRLSGEQVEKMANIGKVFALERPLDRFVSEYF